MSLGLITGPLQMLFSLLLMQGLSLTMFRTFLNQAIPRFDPMKFSMSVGNDPGKQYLASAAPPASPPMDAQNLLPYLQLLAPVILQQQMNRQQNMNGMMTPILATLQPQPQSQMAPAQMAPAQMMPAPAFQIMGSNGQQMPAQVIIMPQVMAQPTSTKVAASTNFPVQMIPPRGMGTRVTKRMLERPPRTTPRPQKVDNRAHAGSFNVHFATPRAPAGFRRFIIPAVTAPYIPDYEVTQSPEPQSYETPTESYYVKYLEITPTSDAVPNTSSNNKDDIPSFIEEETTTTSSVNENLIDSIDRSDSFVTTTAPEVLTLSVVEEDNQTMATIETTTQVSDKTPIVDKNLLNHRINDSNDSNDSLLKDNSRETNQTINDLIHKDFDEYVKNISDNQIESNQSPDLYFENSKENPFDLGTHAFKRVCYYLLRAKDGNLKIKDIDPFICSHLIVGYASVGPNDLIVPRNPSEDPEKYRELTNLKSINRKLKVMLSVGDGSGAAFSKMVSNERSRDKFVASVLDVCDAFDFDGVDIDWEYPYFRTGSKEDKRNFVLILKEIRRESIRRFREDFILSATVGAPLVIAMSSYDIPLIGDAVDFINLMSYDFNVFRRDRPYTGHHSPLYPRPTEKQYYQTLNAAWSATYWANKGMPLHKIVLGIPTYARTYSLVVPVSQGLDVPVTGPGLGGGKLNYTAVCYFLSSGATREFDVYSQVPFAYKNFDWVAYESEISAALKAQWVVKANMGGVMTFALNYDDITGECRRDGKRFPLQKAISNLLELSSIKSYRESSHTPLLSHLSRNNQW